MPSTGFEPATCPLGEGRSIRLSYEGLPDKSNRERARGRCPSGTGHVRSPSVRCAIRIHHVGGDATPFRDLQTLGLRPFANLSDLGIPRRTAARCRRTRISRRGAAPGLDVRIESLAKLVRMGIGQIDLLCDPVQREMNGLALADLQQRAIDIINQLMHNSSSHALQDM